VDNQVLGQIVIDPSEEDMSRGVDRISIVIDRFITIFATRTVRLVGNETRNVTAGQTCSKTVPEFQPDEEGKNTRSNV
jgi:hypothetical protein